MTESGKFFFHFKGFSGTDIYHFESKTGSHKVKKFFSLVKNYFSKVLNIYTTKYLGDQKVFP